jgi:hypothetical protein
MNATQRLLPLIPGLVKSLDHENEHAYTVSSTVMFVLSQSSGVVFANCLEELITLFLDKEAYEMLGKLFNLKWCVNCFICNAR